MKSHRMCEWFFRFVYCCLSRLISFVFCLSTTKKHSHLNAPMHIFAFYWDMVFRTRRTRKKKKNNDSKILRVDTFCMSRICQANRCDDTKRVEKWRTHKAPKLLTTDGVPGRMWGERRDGGTSLCFLNH